MCWLSREIPVKRIAEKDIPVFKIGQIVQADVDKKKVIPYFYPDKTIGTVVHMKGYEEGKAYEEKNISYGFLYGRFFIDRGLHSYSLDNIRIKTNDIASKYRDKPTIQVMTHKTTLISNDVLRNGQCYDTNRIAVLLCTLPKGTTYYVNEVGEIVSDKIKVEKIIQNPFTVNKDNTPNEYSVMKVNKILNEYENTIRKCTL